MGIWAAHQTKREALTVAEGSHEELHCGVDVVICVHTTRTRSARESRKADGWGGRGPGVHLWDRRGGGLRSYRMG